MEAQENVPFDCGNAIARPRIGTEAEPVQEVTFANNSWCESNWNRNWISRADYTPLSSVKLTIRKKLFYRFSAVSQRLYPAYPPRCHPELVLSAVEGRSEGSAFAGC